MSAAAAAPAAEAPAKKGGKKMLIIIIAVVLLLVIGGGAAFFLMKKSAADEEGADGAAEEAPAKVHAAAPERKKDAHKTPPTFVPLDPFVVNLADRDRERYAQIGITLEIEDPHFADELKAYMPAIRNAILLILSYKTAEELLTREGKEQLAEEIRREAVRPLGIEIDDDSHAAPAAPGKKPKKKREVYNPVKQVNFSNFIIQ
jgi:flagellar FliL protein